MCVRPRTLSIFRMTVPQTSTLAIATGNTNHNRLPTSYHLTTVCVPGLFHWGLISKTVRKPIGWECRDRISYDNRSACSSKVDDGHLAQESRHSDEASFALYVFTHGSARKLSHTETCAGWAFTAMNSLQNRDEVPLVEVCGPVETAERGELQRGGLFAQRKTPRRRRR